MRQRTNLTPTDDRLEQRGRRWLKRGATTVVAGSLAFGALASPLASAADTVPPTPTPINFTVSNPTPTPAPANSGTNVSVGNGGNASASADGGNVSVGDVSGEVNISADGGNASADASGGDNNTVIIQQGGTLVGWADVWKGGKYTETGEIEVRSITRVETRIETKVVETRTYDRPCLAVYAPVNEASTQEASATLDFELEVVPSEPVALRLIGLDDQLEIRNQVAIEINGTRVYEGESPFENAVEDASKAKWTRVAMVIPAELLNEGNNQVSVVNISTDVEVDVQQYVLLAKASIRAADDTLLAEAEATSTAGNNRIVIFTEATDDQDKNKGHGNDDDGVDEDNPGNSGGTNNGNGNGNGNKDKKDD